MIDAKQAGERVAKVIYENTIGKSEKELKTVENLLERAIGDGDRSVTIMAEYLNVISRQTLEKLGYTIEYYGGWYGREPEYTIKF